MADVNNPFALVPADDLGRQLAEIVAAERAKAAKTQRENVSKRRKKTVGHGSYIIYYK